MRTTCLLLLYISTVLAVEIIESVNGVLEVEYVLDVHRFSTSWVSFNTRAYNDAAPAPTLMVNPGDTLIVHIKNQLGPNEIAERVLNTLQFANTTNFHTHGLHVSPEGNSDNVLLTIEPNTTKTLEIFIPEDHVSGTFWYHAHVHGSTGCQVGGLLAGALIVKDTTRIWDDLNVEESILLLQGLEVSILDQLLQNFQALNMFDPDIVQTAPSPLGDDNETLLINGEYQPIFQLRPGEFHRFRYINALVSKLVELVVPKCEMYLIAKDGVYYPAPRSVSVVVVPPGGRADVLIRCNTIGTYEMSIDQNSDRDNLLGGSDFRLESQVYAILQVEGPSIQMKLPSSLPLLPWYMKDLRCEPSPDSTFHYEVTFAVNQQTGATERGINFIPFNHETRGVLMKVDQLQQWTVQHNNSHNCGAQTDPTQCGGTYHPVHIHVNHFQIINSTDNLDPDGLRYQLGEWRDTIPMFNNTITIRFIPEKFLGNVMTHCHILIHEDTGMMQLVQVV